MTRRFLFFCLLALFFVPLPAQQSHPRIYVSATQKADFLQRVERSERVQAMVNKLEAHLQPYVDRHQSDPQWMLSRMQMYWKTKYTHVYVNGMDFSHGEGEAPVPTVRFSGSRDWATDYLQPELKDILPYMDDERGLYLQNSTKKDSAWEWTAPSETGHIIEKINREILRLAEEAAFLYWLKEEEKYAVFAADIFLQYTEGMYYREAPQTVENHRNAKLMGLQTFEVIHESVIVPFTVSYDFLYPWLVSHDKDFSMITAVLQKWADQEIKFGVPGNNWNLMQARYITYLALALEQDDHYPDGKGQAYYFDQILNQNSEKQKALVDVMKLFDPETGMWPETAGYSTGVSEDILEILFMIDRVQNNRLPDQFPIVEQAILGSFEYLFPNGFTVAFGDAKHSHLRFNALELLVAHYRKYGDTEKEARVTGQLKKAIADKAYQRQEINSLFKLFLYVDELADVPPASDMAEFISPFFYAPNVSWLVQRNGMDRQEGMMISENASLGNHSHANGINIELYAKGMVIAPDAAAGVSYWSKDHREYYKAFPAHNTVVVDGKSDYRTMLSYHAFTLDAAYPLPGSKAKLISPYTFADVSFTEPSTDARQQRLTATIRTGENSGYFVDIFRSARADGKDVKHEYLFHSQGTPIILTDENGDALSTAPTDELSSKHGDLVGYDYFTNKQAVSHGKDFVAQFQMPTFTDNMLHLNLWMQGFPGRQVFTVMAPPSRAINSASVPKSLYKQKLPTLVVRQPGEARNRPFVSIIEAFRSEEGAGIKQVAYFSPKAENTGCVGIEVHSHEDQTDYLFNDENGEQVNAFDKHDFQGRFGVVSYRKDAVQALFLGAGKLLKSGQWQMESKEENTVSVLIQPEGMFIEARHPFRLTLPLPNAYSEQITLVAGEQTFPGKIITLNSQRLAVFELPELAGILVQFK